MVRLLRAIPTATLADGLTTLKGDPRSADVTTEALDAFRVLFLHESGEGVVMTRAATGGLEDPDTLAQSTIILAADLTAALDARQ